MEMQKLMLGLSALALSAVAMSAQASGSAAAGLLEIRELNLIVLGNMSGGDDVEGKTFVGGNLTNGATYGIGRSNQSFTPSSFPTLTVGGSAGGNININNGSNGMQANGVTPAGATIGGSVGNINLNANNATLLVGGSISNTNGGNGATLKAGGSLGGNAHPNGVDVEGNLGPSFSNPLVAGIAAQTTTLSADLKSLSAALGGLTVANNPSSYNNSNPNAVTLTARDPNHLGYAVIDITGGQSAFQNANNFVYDIPTVAGGGYLATIVNVSGSSSYTFNANSNNSLYNPYVIWNFEGATGISFNRQFNGSVLAPLATISNSSPIEGSVAVAGFNQGGEVHLGTFGGASPFGGAVPEPAAWAMMIAGFGMIGTTMRRRRSAPLVSA